MRTDAPPPRSPDPDTPARGRRPGRWQKIIWPALLLFQLGVIAASYRIWNHSPSAPVEPAAAARARPVEDNLPPAEPPSNDLGRADDLMREGRYDLALALYQPAATGAAAALRDALLYRVALCQEGLGRAEEALATYRAVAGRARPVPAAAALLGQARVCLRVRHPVEARPLLCDLLLRSAQRELHQQPLLAEAAYLFALGLALEAVNPDKPGPLNDALAGHTAADWPVEHALDWGTAAAADQGSVPVPADALEVQRVGKDGLDALVRASCAAAPVPEFVSNLADKSALKVEWSTAAFEQVNGRTVRLALDGVPLADVLRALAAAHGLIWKVQGSTLRFATELESPGDALTAYRMHVARRALRGALLSYPGHPLATAACLEAGNLEAAAGDVQEAVTWYERLAKEGAASSASPEASYNLGLLYQRLGNSRAARTAMYRVADGSPGHELAPLAYFKVGTHYLEDGAAEQAVSPLRRAMAASRGSSVRPAAAVALAAAYLLTDNPGAANTLLREQRETVGQPPYRAVAAFLDALARYRVLTDRKQRQRDAGAVLAALLAVRDDNLLGNAGKLLAGQAYQDLGLLDETAALYEKALKQARGPLASEMSYGLAESLHAAGKRDAAVRRWTALATADGERWAGRAQLRLAELAVREQHPEECLQWCRKLLPRAEPADTAPVLKLMGQAYQQLGDDRRAAACFAGKAPE